MSYRKRAETYDVEYQESRDLDFVLGYLDTTSRHALEVPCGSGRLARHMARRVDSVTLIDIEPTMLARAVSRVRATGPSCKVRGLVQDMRKIDLDDPADFVVFPREGLQLLPPEDARDALASASSNLAPGGRILVDLATFSGLASPADPDYFRHDQADGALRHDWVRPAPDGGTLARSTIQSRSADSILFEFRYCRSTPAGTDRWTSKMRLFLFPNDWIFSAVPDECRISAVYGGYDRSRLHASSHRIVAIMEHREPLRSAGQR